MGVISIIEWLEKARKLKWNMSLPKKRIYQVKPFLQAEPGSEFIFRQVGRAGLIDHGLGGDQADGPAGAAGRQVSAP